MENNINTTKTETTEDLFGDVISRYTRAQALEDGTLVEVPAKLASEAGFRYPVALTTEAASWVLPSKMPACQSAEGRLWDVLFMLRNAIRVSRGGEAVYFRVLLVGGRKAKKIVTFKCVCGPSDDASPCMTVMMPEED